MKISPVASVAATTGVMPQGATESVGQRMRSLKMNTNATPGRFPDADPSIPATTEGATEAPEETQPLSPQFAALAKQRRALQLERQAFEREKAEKGAAAPSGDAVTLADLKRDPMGMIRKAGLTYDDLVTHVTNDSGNSSEISALKAEIAALKGDVDKRFVDNKTQEEKHALAAMSREATAIAAAAGDTFELVRETRSVPIVMDLIEKTYRKTGEVIDVREALKLVEDELLADMQKRMSLSKVQKAFAPPPAPAPQSRHLMRTLTNRDTAQAPMSAKQRAIAAFRGELKP